MNLLKKLNQQINQLLEKAEDNKKKRDELNKQVKELKSKRKELLEKLQGNRKILEELVEKEHTVDQAKIRKKRVIMGKLSKKIDDLEWNLQTSVLSPEEEKGMIQQLEKLSDQLNKVAEEVHITQKQTQLWREISSDQKKINQLFNQITDYAKESQIYHNLMNQHFHQVNLLRKQANEYHKQFLANKKSADQYHKEFLSTVTEKNELRGKLKDYQQKVRKEMQEKVRLNLEENTKKAFEKYQNGENLTLEEFRLLVEKGMI